MYPLWPRGRLAGVLVTHNLTPSMKDFRISEAIGAIGDGTQGPLGTVPMFFTCMGGTW